MTAHWYCNDCDARIDRAEIDDHEADGHSVRGVVRPNRLIGNDPWNVELSRTDPNENDEVSD